MNSLATNLFNALPSVNSTPSVTEIGTLVAAVGGAVATFVVSHRALRGHGSFGSQRLLALCTAVLAFFGLLSAGPLILIPYTALGVVCLLLPLVALVSRRWNLPWPRWPSEPRQPRQINPTLLSSPQPNPQQVDPEPSRAPARPGKRIIPLEIRHPGKRATQSRRRAKNL